MKKIIVMIMAGLVASATLADIQSYKFQGGNAATEGVTASQTFHSILDTDTTIDMYSFISGNTIDIANLAGFNASRLNSIAIAVQPPFLGGAWASGTVNSTDDTAVGQYVYGLISGVSDFSSFAAGDTFVLTQLDGPITAGSTPANPTPQVFGAGTLSSTITVVPEPATVGLFGLGALSAWVIRRNKQKAIEEEEEI